MNKELIIPVYLNQKIVFDLLAIYENGFTQIRSIQKQNSSSENSEASVQGEIGTSNIFSLLGVKLGSKLKGEKEEGESENISEERVHTPTSLFANLLHYLTQDKKIKNISTKSEISNIKPGDFVSFSGTLKVNPLIKVFESFIKLMELAVLFQDPPPASKPANKNQSKPNTSIVTQIKSLTESLKLGDMIDLICEIEPEFQAVLQSEYAFFNNKSIIQIEEGEYKVLGKVVMLANQESGKSINLLRNTSISLAREAFMDKLLEGFKNQDFEKIGFEIPKIETQIRNGMLIIPIAIYV